MNNQQPQEPQLNTPLQQPSQLQPAQTFLKRWMPTIAGIAVVVLVGGGVFAYQAWRSEPTEPTTEELQEQQEGTTPTEFPDAGERVEDETADSSSDEVLQDWKTYRSEDFGFEVKYPDIYENSGLCFDQENPKHFMRNSTHTFCIKGGNLNGKSMEEWVQVELGLPSNQSLYNFIGNLGWDYNFTTIEGKKWFYLHQAEGPGLGNFHYIIDNDSRVVNFYSHSNVLNEGALFFEQILSTFKFIN